MTKQKFHIPGRTVLILLILSVLWPANRGNAEYSRENAVVRAVRKVSPAVVNVSTETPVQGNSGPFQGFGNPLFDSFFRDFFEAPPQPHRYERSSLGSGVIIDGQKGLVLTNAHVIANAGKITVTLRDERELEAAVVGADSDSDLAVLRISSDQPLPSVVMGNSDDLMIGEDVIAIGNPFGFSHTVTKGVVSALNRSIRAEDTVYHDFIQTDASINPGNSGGPLLNINGELIGINTAIYAKAQGIGFAIPINRAGRIISDLLTHGEVTKTWIGISVQNMNRRMAQYLGFTGKGGVLVRQVEKGAPARKAGIREGDIITSLGGFDVKSAGDFNSAMKGYAAGDAVKIALWRDGKILKITVTAAAFPVERAADMAYDLMGVRVRDGQGGNGVVISQIRPRSYLESVGAQPGDIIRQIDDMPVRNTQDFEKAVVEYRNRPSVVILLQRGNRGYYITVKF